MITAKTNVGRKFEALNLGKVLIQIASYRRKILKVVWYGLVEPIRSLFFHLKLSCLYRERSGISDQVLDKTVQPKTLCLDSHYALADEVIDLAEQFSEISLWSLSHHRNLSPRGGRFPTPLKIIDSRNWEFINVKRALEFRKVYERVLTAHTHGFITPTLGLLDLLARDLPTLAMVGTRYEFPFTWNSENWKVLHRSMCEHLDRGMLTIGANNRGDVDYIEFYAGLTVSLVPSLRLNPGNSWRGISDKKYIYLRKDRVSPKNCWPEPAGSKFNFEYIGFERAFEWSELCDCSEILVIPQNISTMFLFELSSAGIPVAIPDRKWMEDLYLAGVALGELSFAQVRGVDVCDFGRDGPADPNWTHYLDWWLDRADFYDTDLMPNVRIVSSVDEFLSGGSGDRGQLRSATAIRNSRISEQRELFVKGFYETKFSR